MSTPDEVLERARQVIDAAAAEGLTVRLLGGVAVYARATETTRARFGRDFQDFDLIGHRKESRPLRAVLERLGYLPDKPFNAAHGDRRLLFFTADGADHLDVFLDLFEMSHTLDLRERLGIEPLALPAADLLLTKLQVYELNRKDAQDLVMLLADHELGDADGPGRLNARHVARLCAEDWGLYTTVGDNLDKLRRLLPELGLSAAEQAAWEAKIDGLLRVLAEEPKGVGWRLRDRIGRRKRWYRLPDESIDEV